MPMPPPRASWEPRRDHQVAHEMSQIVRALHENGAQSPEQLASLVGARYWDEERFDRAVALCEADGVVVRLPDGRLQGV